MTAPDIRLATLCANRLAVFFMDTSLARGTRALGTALLFSLLTTSPDVAADATGATVARLSGDWAALNHYREANASLKPDNSRVVFMGDSITENWAREPRFAANPHFVGRGVSGQTTQQMLVRFRADVIDLRPAVVHIMGGTNDVAENTGPETDAEIQDAIASMVQLALANKIKVLLASIPPAADIPWRPGLQPAPRIRRLNEWLKAYARESGARYVDYWSALATPDGAMKPGLAADGLHPDSAGYAVMEPVMLAALRAASLRESAP
jgi:lysophospholipase L1-like esterase